MRIVVGLGNPGLRYEKTRHNVGFEVIRELARRYDAGKPKLDFEAEVADIIVGTEKTILVAPQTYMNLSGRSVRRVVDFYKLPLAELLVVCDDFNLETGRLRLRPGGSDGGQNGLKDIINRLGSEQFARLRVGIGRPPGRMQKADFVLSKFRNDEPEIIEHAVLRAADGIEIWVRSGLQIAMNQVNAPEPD